MKTEEYFNEGTPFKSMKPILRVGDVSSSILSPDEYIRQNDGKMQHEYLKQDKIRYDWFMQHMKDYAEYVYSERTKIV